MPPMPYRYRRHPFSRDYVVRTVERAGTEMEITFAARNGEWVELLDPDGWSVVVSPGARHITVKEFVGTAARPIQRLGDWIEIRGDVASAEPAVLRWCRRNANSELPSGAFLLKPQTWNRHDGEQVPLPFVPEFDHPDRKIRELAGIETGLRKLVLAHQTAVDRRRDAIAAAAAAGHSRRSLGRLVDLSYTRVQQLIDEAQATAGRGAVGAAGRRRP